MRRRKKHMKKLRVKIIEDTKNGLTYDEIQRKRGVSSRTVANLVKGKDLKRFCKMCGETDPQKLDEHHPDKANRPNETITLCANCHAPLSRKQQPKRTGEKKTVSVTPKIIPSLNTPTLQRIITQPQVSYAQWKPFTPREKRWIGRGFCYGTGGIAVCEGIFDTSLSRWLRIVLTIGGGILVYTGSRIK